MIRSFSYPSRLQAGSSTYLYLKVPSLITFRIASCLLRNIYHIKREAKAGTYWCSGLGLAWTWLLAHSPCQCPGPLAGRAFVLFLSLQLVSPGFVPVPVCSESSSQLQRLLDFIRINSPVCPCLGFSLVIPILGLCCRFCFCFSPQPDPKPRFIHVMV